MEELKEELKKISIWTTDFKNSYHKNYYSKNKEKMINQLTKKVDCEKCGKKNISSCNLKSHQKTKKCIKKSSKKPCSCTCSSSSSSSSSTEEN